MYLYIRTVFFVCLDFFSYIKTGLLFLKNMQICKPLGGHPFLVHNPLPPFPHLHMLQSSRYLSPTLYLIPLWTHTVEIQSSHLNSVDAHYVMCQPKSLIEIINACIAQVVPFYTRHSCMIFKDFR
jgi:hypothetical protein